MLAASSVSIINVNDGAQGPQGPAGASAPKITQQKEQFYLSTSATSLSGGSWGYTEPSSIPDGKYMWRRVENIMSDGTSVYSNAVYSSTIGGLINVTDNISKQITQKVWETDIQTKLNEYDNSTTTKIGQAVSNHEQTLSGLTTTVSDLETEVALKADGQTVTQLQNTVASNEQTAQGFRNTVIEQYTRMLGVDYDGDISGTNLLVHSANLVNTDWVLSANTATLNENILKLSPTTSGCSAKYKATHLTYDLYKDKAYTLSFYARRTAGTSGYTNGAITVYMGVNANSRIESHYNASYDRYKAFTVAATDITTGWKKFSFTVNTIPTELNTGTTNALQNTSIITFQFSTVAKTLPIEIRAIMFEQSTAASEYCPSPIEVSTKISSIEQKADEVAIRVSSVEDDLDTSKNDSLISVTKNQILQSVSASYALKSDAITNTVIQYAVGDSNTSAPTTGWGTASPQWQSGKYIWQRTAITKNGSTTYSNVACIQGAKGEDGNGIQSVTITYGKSSSPSTQPTEWKTSISAVGTLSGGEYLWTKKVTDYVDPTMADTTELTYSKQGETGQAGTSATITSIKYKQGTSATTPPTGDDSTWSSSPVTVPQGYYLWTKTKYSTGDVAYGVARQGVNGTNGTNGRGITDVIPRYCLWTSDGSDNTKPANDYSSATYGWFEDKKPNWVSGMYLWTQSKIVYDDTTIEYTDAVCDNGLTGIEERVTQAEQRVLPDAIIQTVRQYGTNNLMSLGDVSFNTGVTGTVDGYEIVATNEPSASKTTNVVFTLPYTLFDINEYYFLTFKYQKKTGSLNYLRFINGSDAYYEIKTLTIDGVDYSSSPYGAKTATDDTAEHSVVVVFKKKTSGTINFEILFNPKSSSTAYLKINFYEIMLGRGESIQDWVIASKDSESYTRLTSDRFERFYTDEFGDYAGVKESIDEFYVKFGNMKIGGRNMIIGTNEPNVDVVVPYIRDQSIPTDLSEGIVSNSEHGFRITNTSSVKTYIRFGDISRNCFIIGQGRLDTDVLELIQTMGFVAGYTYTLSFQARFKLLSLDSQNWNSVPLQVKFTDNNNNVISKNIYSIDIDKGLERSCPAEFTFTIPQGVTNCQLEISCADDNASHYGTDDYIEVNNLMLEQSTLASNWSPAPEEQMTENKVYTLIEANKDMIRMQTTTLMWEALNSSLDASGWLMVSGAQIGPWQVNNECIYRGNGNFYNAGSLYFGEQGLSLGNTFKVTSGGQLTATGATINGILTANAGSSIGPWNITATSIWKGSSTYNTANGMYFGNDGLSIGTTFRVSSGGALNATSGFIGGWNIGTAALTTTNSSGNYVYIGNGSNSSQDVIVIRNGAGTTANPYSYPFYVRADGTLVATKGTIGGCSISNGVLQIANANITGTLSGNKISGGTISGSTLSGGTISGGSINIGNGVFQVTTGGAMTATSATIGGIHVTSNAIYSGSHNAYNSSNQGFYLGSGGLFGVGNGDSYLRWTGSDLTIRTSDFAWDSDNSSMDQNGSLTIADATFVENLQSANHTTKLVVRDACLKGYLNDQLCGLIDLQADYMGNTHSNEHASVYSKSILHLQAEDTVSIETGSNGYVDIPGTLMVNEITSAKLWNNITIYFGSQEGAYLKSDSDQIKMGKLGASSHDRKLVCDGSNRMKIYSSSSIRYKDFLGYASEDDVIKLLDLPVVIFKYKDGYLSEDDENYGKSMVGLFAEDVEKRWRDAVYHYNGEVENYVDRQLLVRVIKLCQIQQDEINELKNQLNALLKVI